MKENTRRRNRNIEIRHYLAGQQVTAEEFVAAFAAEVRAGWEKTLGVTLPEVVDGPRRIDCRQGGTHGR